MKNTTKPKTITKPKKEVKERTPITVTFDMNKQDGLVLNVVEGFAMMCKGKHRGGGTDLRTNIRDTTYEFPSRKAAQTFTFLCAKATKMRIKSITKLEGMPK